MNKNTAAVTIHLAVTTVAILGAVLINDLGGGVLLAIGFIFVVGAVDFAVSKAVMKGKLPPK